MGRRAIPEKVKKRIWQEANMRCAKCEESDVDTLEIHHIKAVKSGGTDDKENLILLCSNCHSKITAGDISEAEVLRLKISLITGTRTYKESSGDVVGITGDITNSTVANTIEIKTQNAKVKINPPSGTIASSADHRNYVKHLIDRYHDFKKDDVGKDVMNYRIFYGSIKRQFGAKWDLIRLDKFDELSAYLQRRIDNTILGKKQKARGRKRYSTFEEYLEK